MAAATLAASAAGSPVSDIETRLVLVQVCLVVGDPADELGVILRAVYVEFAILAGAATPAGATSSSCWQIFSERLVDAFDDPFLLDQAADALEQVFDLVAQVLHFERDATALRAVGLAGVVVLGTGGVQFRLARRVVGGLRGDAFGAASQLVDQAGIAVLAAVRALAQSRSVPSLVS